MGPVQTLLPANSMIPEGQSCAVLNIKDCFFSIPLHSEDKEQFAFSVVFQVFASKWKIALVQGIPYNCTRQAIVERANQTLKSKLEVLAKVEGFTSAVPPGDEAQLLATAMLALNQFPRGDETKSPVQKHWAVQAMEEGPPVTIKNELGEWEQGWQLVLAGRGYAAVKKEGNIKWCPLKSIKPELRHKSNKNCEFLSAGQNLCFHSLCILVKEKNNRPADTLETSEENKAASMPPCYSTSYNIPTNSDFWTLCSE
ncbi:hypothetical protein HGM15179_017147 [Zosterops borbonicus]|uniref:Integrase catalytic domain-containing protein n=1 Tax=Zosterops borbonicus TaxID=364589 RepID=A0A8K1LDM4_9PASS|nr:hypothetical protein HGM15179_017147 [Zosterops borbonicus]